MKVIVTGAAGFIGSNLLRGLNAIGIDEIVAVDDLGQGDKFANLVGARIADCIEPDGFYERFARGAFGAVDIVFHQGACTDTMQTDGRLMMARNYRCTRELLDACLRSATRLVYASSAAVYGAGTAFSEEPRHERPLNVYAYSKLLADEVVRRCLPSAPAQIAGLRYFNVYGPREQHKGRMASVALHQFHEFRRDGSVQLFGAYGGYAAGEQARDFVHVDDVVAVNLWLLEHPPVRGIFNVGSGCAQTFNEVAVAVLNACRAEDGLAPLSCQRLVQEGLLRYRPFPAELVGRYQCYTCADLSRLRGAGCDLAFSDVAGGVSRYVRWLLDRG